MLIFEFSSIFYQINLEFERIMLKKNEILKFAKRVLDQK
jgi:hypothetical protein